MAEVHSYSPVGRCIYCDDTTGPFSEEHVIPYALGGKLILPEASCKNCAKETGKVEQACCRTMLGNFRIKANFPTRRKNERPKSLTLHVVENNDQVTVHSVPVSEYPPTLVLPKFPEPTIFQGLVGVDTFVLRTWAVFDPENFERIKKSFGGKGYRMGALNPMLFARMLAKIAHAHAVAIFGYGSFSPLLLDLIQGRRKIMTDLVGGSLDNQPFDSNTYYVGLSLRRGVPNLLYAKIRLLGMYGAPDYRVVVGVVSDEFVAAATERGSISSQSTQA